MMIQVIPAAASDDVPSYTIIDVIDDDNAYCQVRFYATGSSFIRQVGNAILWFLVCRLH